MYYLDVNFLNDRPDYKKDAGKSHAPAKGPIIQDPKPLLIGGGAALALLAIVGGTWLFLTNQTAKLQGNLTELQGKLEKLNVQIKDIDAIKANTKVLSEEANALASVFNDIKPWSALLGEFGILLPPGTIVSKIEQKDGVLPASAAAPPPPPPPASPPPAGSAAAPPPAPPPPPSVTPVLTITGTANSYGEVNDLLLLLNNSPLFKAENTKLVSATEIKNPVVIQLQDPGDAELVPAVPELPPVVEYKMEVSLSDTGADEILAKLKNLGAIGLVDRIETLKQKGVI